jgi:hypothetical protein
MVTSHERGLNIGELRNIYNKDTKNGAENYEN